MGAFQPLFSVILPVYNGEAYLRTSIESVLAQKFPDFELIIWNNGSTDLTRTIIEEYHDRRIRVFHSEKNWGLFKALNKMIGESCGTLIKLWSHDDIMEPSCLQEFAEFFRLHPDVPMVYCDVEIIGPTGNTIASFRKDETPDIIEPLLATQLLFYYGCIPGNIANVALRRNIFNEVGLFNEALVQAGDFEKWIQIGREHRLGRITKPLIRLRSHRKQLSKNVHSGVTFMQEEYPLFEILRKRLPPELEEFALEYMWKRRYVKHMHHLFHCLVRGDFFAVSQVYRHIKKESLFIPLFLWWLISVNGRFFSVRPRFVSAI